MSATFQGFYSESNIDDYYRGLSATQALDDMAYSYDDTTHTYSCDDPAEGDGVGLWQATFDDYTSGVRLWSTIVVCRYGPNLWNRQPECPFSACLDTQCSTCATDWVADASPEPTV